MEKGKFVVPIKSIRTQFMPLVLRWTSSAEAAFVSREHVEAEASIASSVIHVTHACQHIGVLGFFFSLSLSLHSSYVFFSQIQLCVLSADVFQQQGFLMGNCSFRIIV
jgi:hypothetical protein